MDKLKLFFFWVFMIIATSLFLLLLVAIVLLPILIYGGILSVPDEIISLQIIWILIYSSLIHIYINKNWIIKEGEKLLRSHLTAMARKDLSKPVREMIRTGIITKDLDILDYGCGRGYDVLELKRREYRIDGYDPYPGYGFDVLDEKKTYDIILMTYVLNVISSQNELEECIRKAFCKLKHNGKIIITVRSKSDIDYQAKTNNWKQYDELAYTGWITNRNTFQKGFDVPELYKYISRVKDYCSYTPTEVNIGRNSTCVIIDTSKRRFQSSFL